MEQSMVGNLENEDPVYNGIICKKKKIGSSKSKIKNGILLYP